MADDRIVKIQIMAGPVNGKAVDQQQQQFSPMSPIQPYRRSSLAVPLHANLTVSATSSGTDVSPFHVVGSARRRLSNVSDVVSRKISHTIGWRTVSASVELIVSQVLFHISFIFYLYF